MKITITIFRNKVENKKTYRKQGGKDWVDEAAGGPAETENREDQEGDSSSERQAGRPESERRKA